MAELSARKLQGAGVGRYRRWFATLALIVLALALGIYAAIESRPRPDGAPVLALTLPDASGKEHALSQYRGKVVVVNFWATWCAPCREEMPEFIRAQSEFGDRGLQFVGIAVDDADKVERFSKELGLNYPALIGGYGAVELSKTLGNNLAALPFSIILDRNGTVVHTQLGPLKPAQLRSIVSKLL